MHSNDSVILKTCSIKGIDLQWQYLMNSCPFLVWENLTLVMYNTTMMKKSRFFAHCCRPQIDNIAPIIVRYIWATESYPLQPNHHSIMMSSFLLTSKRAFGSHLGLLAEICSNWDWNFCPRSSEWDSFPGPDLTARLYELVCVRSTQFCIWSCSCEIFEFCSWIVFRSSLVTFICLVSWSFTSCMSASILRDILSIISPIILSVLELWHPSKGGHCFHCLLSQVCSEMSCAELVQEIYCKFRRAIGPWTQLAVRIRSQRASRTLDETTLHRPLHRGFHPLCLLLASHIPHKNGVQHAR